MKRVKKRTNRYRRGPVPRGDLEVPPARVGWVLPQRRDPVLENMEVLLVPEVHFQSISEALQGGVWFPFIFRD